ncbi:MAG: SDR family NAD(P)-dependent oxidoreductase, partial [Acidobacteriota bacterium]|nr:SDR family NAD(P)-dependent oxidoreductase [Acidobacteriota bacterium]
MNLSKHKVLVTGGGSGIGLEIAREFVTRGNQVAICGRDSKKLKLAQSSIGAQAAIRCDLAEPYAIPKLVADTSRSLGGLSILVNNAGIQYNYNLLEKNPNEVFLDAAEEIQVNFTSLVALTAASIPALSENPQAAVVNI